jgi:isopenicillin N synthase-like dioxygenase
MKVGLEVGLGLILELRHHDTQGNLVFTISHTLGCLLGCCSQLLHCPTHNPAAAACCLAVRCREVNERYMREMARVSFRLLEVFALGLGLQPRALDSIFQPSHTSFLRLNYYVSAPRSLE